MSKIERNIQLVPQRRIFAADGEAVNVILNGVSLMTWFQTKASKKRPKTYTALAQIGYETFMELDTSRVWVPVKPPEEKDRLIIEGDDLLHESGLAIDAMFGKAFDLRIEFVPGQYGQSYEVYEGNELVLVWHDHDGYEDEFLCFIPDDGNPDGDGTKFAFYSGSTYGFDPRDEDGTFEDRCGHADIGKVTPFAYHALKQGWVNKS